LDGGQPSPAWLGPCIDCWARLAQVYADTYTNEAVGMNVILCPTDLTVMRAIEKEPILWLFL